MAKDPNYDLSIIILNFNVRPLLLKCLESIYKSKGKEDKWQVIVVDNASSDGSLQAVKEKYGMDSRFRGNDKVVELVENQSNLGFAAGNNVAIPKAKADVLLFLNPDTVVLDHAIQKSLEVLQSDPKIGALTCKVVLPDGSLDYSCHRGFPTPWNAFCYFTSLSRLFPSLKLFSGYTATYLDISKPHEVDCISGSFFMIRRRAGQEVGWWDEDYFWYGEDVDFCFRLKNAGWKIFFYPQVQIRHFKGSSSGLWKSAGVLVPSEVSLKMAKASIAVMRVFYAKHYYRKYPPLLRDLVLFGITLLEKYRLLKVSLGFGI